jgi:hypothetical protein
MVQILQEQRKSIYSQGISQECRNSFISCCKAHFPTSADASSNKTLSVRPPWPTHSLPLPYITSSMLSTDHHLTFYLFCLFLYLLTLALDLWEQGFPSYLFTLTTLLDIHLTLCQVNRGYLKICIERISETHKAKEYQTKTTCKNKHVWNVNGW